MRRKTFCQKWRKLRFSHFRFIFAAYNVYIERSETNMKKIIVTLLLAALVLAAVPALAQNAFTAADGGIVPTIPVSYTHLDVYKRQG